MSLENGVPHGSAGLPVTSCAAARTPPRKVRVRTDFGCLERSPEPGDLEVELGVRVLDPIEALPEVLQLAIRALAGKESTVDGDLAEVRNGGLLDPGADHARRAGAARKQRMRPLHDLALVAFQCIEDWAKTRDGVQAQMCSAGVNRAAADTDSVPGGPPLGRRHP